MKNILNFLILLCASNFFSSQNKIINANMQVIYSMDFKADSTISNTSNDILALYIGDKISVFQNEKKYKIDSLIASQLYFQNTSSKPLFKVNHVIYKDHRKSEMTYSEIIENVNLGYNEKLPPMDWKLISEKKKILDYECSKAETFFGGRKFIAWYTNQIPINEGPYKFSGLPGLILEVSDDKNNFHYQLLAIIKKEQNILYKNDVHLTEKKKLIETKMNLIKKITKSDVKVNPLEKK